MSTIAQILASKKQALEPRNYAVPGFYTQNSKGEKVSTVRYAFLKRLYLTREQFSSYKLSYDAKEWTIVIDQTDAQEIKEDIAFEGFSKCQVSFQVHKHGNFAVYRRDRKEKVEA